MAMCPMPNARTSECAFAFNITCLSALNAVCLSNLAKLSKSDVREIFPANRMIQFNN